MRHAFYFYRTTEVDDLNGDFQRPTDGYVSILPYPEATDTHPRRDRESSASPGGNKSKIDT